ncbi:MAG: hypothetical protein WC323_04500 [Patescibacteria group bacterium]
MCSLASTENVQRFELFLLTKTRISLEEFWLMLQYKVSELKWGESKRAGYDIGAPRAFCKWAKEQSQYFLAYWIGKIEFSTLEFTGDISKSRAGLIAKEIISLKDFWRLLQYEVIIFKLSESEKEGCNIGIYAAFRLWFKNYFPAFVECWIGKVKF